MIGRDRAGKLGTDWAAGERNGKIDNGQAGRGRSQGGGQDLEGWRHRGDTSKQEILACKKNRCGEGQACNAGRVAQAGGRESFIYTPLIQSVILGFGWRNTYLALAAVSAVFIIGLAQFLRHLPKDMGLLPEEEGESQALG